MSRAAIVSMIATVLTFTTLPLAFAATATLSSAGTETGIAACYSRHLAGHRTASGKRYNPNSLTAAHANIPMGSHVRVTNLKNGKSVVVLIDDHMSSHAGGRIIMDVSHRACKDLEFGRGGEAKVKIEVLSANTTAKSH